MLIYQSYSKNILNSLTKEKNNFKLNLFNKEKDINYNHGFKNTQIKSIRRCDGNYTNNKNRETAFLNYLKNKVGFKSFYNKLIRLKQIDRANEISHILEKCFIIKFEFDFNYILKDKANILIENKSRYFDRKIKNQIYEIFKTINIKAYFAYDEYLSILYHIMILF